MQAFQVSEISKFSMDIDRVGKYSISVKNKMRWIESVECAGPGNNILGEGKIFFSQLKRRGTNMTLRNQVNVMEDYIYNEETETVENERIKWVVTFIKSVNKNLTYQSNPS